MTPSRSTLPSPWTSHSVSSSSGTHLFVEETGNGPPLLLCDGLMCDGHIWRHLNPHFSHHQLIHWHYPGHGRSGTPTKLNRLNPAALADDAFAVLEHLPVENPVVIAHSFGVQVALELAHRYPERVRGLVLICGAPGKLIQTFNDSAALKMVLPLLGAGTRFVPRHITRLWQSLPRTGMSRLARRTPFVNRRLMELDDLQPYFEGLSRTDINTAVRIMEEADRHDMSPHLYQVHTPALVIAGKRDRFTPSHLSKKLADGLPHATLFLSNNGTHALPLEQPDLVNLKIDEFLATLD